MVVSAPPTAKPTQPHRRWLRGFHSPEQTKTVECHSEQHQGQGFEHDEPDVDQRIRAMFVDRVGYELQVGSFLPDRSLGSAVGQIRYCRLDELASDLIHRRAVGLRSIGSHLHENHSDGVEDTSRNVPEDAQHQLVSRAQIDKQQHRNEAADSVRKRMSPRQIR